MEMIADGLLIAGAAGAALYCRALATRLARLKDLDSGLGAAIAALSRQVDELRASLEQAKEVSGGQTRELAQLAARAEMAAGRLELLLASLHEGGRRKSVGETAERRRRRLFDDDEDDAPAPAPRRRRDDGFDEDAADAALARLRAEADAREARDPAERARREDDLRATLRRAFERNGRDDDPDGAEARQA